EAAPLAARSPAPDGLISRNAACDHSAPDPGALTPSVANDAARSRFQVLLPSCAQSSVCATTGPGADPLLAKVEALRSLTSSAVSPAAIPFPYTDTASRLRS